MGVTQRWLAVDDAMREVVRAELDGGDMETAMTDLQTHIERLMLDVRRSELARRLRQQQIDEQMAAIRSRAN